MMMEIMMLMVDYLDNRDYQRSPICTKFLSR